MQLTTNTKTLSTLSNADRTQLSRLQQEMADLQKQINTFNSKQEAGKRMDAARRTIIKKTFFSTTQAAQKVGMPVTSFKRFVEKFSLRHSATLDGAPAYSPEWIDAFNNNRDAMEFGANSFTLLGRKEGRTVMDRAVRAVNKFASSVDYKPETKKSVSDTGIQPRRLVDRKGKVMIAVTNSDGSNTYRDASGKVITTTTPVRSYKTDSIEAFKEANLRKHEESRKRYEAEKEARRKVEVLKAKGFTPVVSVPIPKDI